jgi:hypothetical protein
MLPSHCKAPQTIVAPTASAAERRQADEGNREYVN